MSKIYDVAIVGAGPAGLSAALTLKLHEKNIIWFGSHNMSDKVSRSEMIANYPGIASVSGEDLVNAFKKQADEMGLTITDKQVTDITKTTNGFMLLAKGEVYQCKSVLLATGANTVKAFENEDSLLGRGVSYCATCDGFLYKGKDIAVCCYSPDFEDEVEFLSSLAKTVYLYTPYKSIPINLPNVTYLQSPVTKIEGSDFVTGVTLFDGTKIEVDGVFILRKSLNPTTLVHGLEIDGEAVVINRQCETNKDGVFAAGDVTGRPYQIAKAVGEGNVAAHTILKYLGEKQ